MDEAAVLADQLIRLVEHTRTLVIRLMTAVDSGTGSAVIYAAQALREHRGVLAAVEVRAETLAAAHRLGRTEGWHAGFAAGFAAARHRTGSQPALRAVGD